MIDRQRLESGHRLFHITAVDQFMTTLVNRFWLGARVGFSALLHDPIHKLLGLAIPRFYIKDAIVVSHGGIESLKRYTQMARNHQCLNVFGTCG